MIHFLLLLLLTIVSSYSYSSIKLLNSRRTSFLLNVARNSIEDPVKSYFKYWNQRNMTAAANLFSNDCVYEDTLYPNVFIGRDNLKQHLLNVASAVPPTFEFIIDNISPSNGKPSVIGVQWHVESNGAALPFTRGCSVYTVNSDGLISTGFDVPEPVIKAGSINLYILQLARKFIIEPRRAFAAVFWVFYCWLLFFSDVAPGLNAFQMDPNTWAEVRDLSLNFWLVLPTVSLASAPHIHPMLEGTFNLVLVWSGLFAGFLIDGRTKKSSLSHSMISTVLGMQLLTNAIYLPYLVSRDVEDKCTITSSSFQSLTLLESAAESRALPAVLFAVGCLSVYWSLAGRVDEYGEWTERFSSYLHLIQSDRLTFSLVVDLLYYTIFQGWLIDSDFRRRVDLSESGRYGWLKVIGKWVPFAGLATYLLLRPPLCAVNNKETNEISI